MPFFVFIKFSLYNVTFFTRDLFRYSGTHVLTVRTGSYAPVTANNFLGDSCRHSVKKLAQLIQVSIFVHLCLTLN